MKLYFVRHGETTHNRDCIIQGWFNSELTKLGREQARLTGKLLAEKTVINAIFSSDLIRARQTAEHISAVFSNDVPVFYDWLLRERTFGEYENKSRLSIDCEELFANPDDDWPYGIESPVSLDNRMIAFVKNLKLLPVHFDNIIVITHGGMLNTLRRIDGQSDWKKHDNAEIVEYDFDELIRKIERGIK